MRKVLLDENLPKPLMRHFSEEFEVSTVSDEGWASLKNGELLAAMSEAGFNYLLTADRNLEYQQSLEKYPIQLVVLISFDNRYKTLLPHVLYTEEMILNNGEEKILHIDLRDR